MPQPHGWVHEVVWALTDLGGVASLDQLYDRIETHGVMDFKANAKWDSAVRTALQKHSSDSDMYSGGEDLFYSVDGKGGGRWGLRSLVPQTPTAVDMPTSADRVLSQVYRILRDTALARYVKAVHECRCQLCGSTVVLSDGSRYAEGHHIQPLGRPHNGPDVIGNILCVCPTHHVQLDYGCIHLELSQVRSHDSHRLDPQFLDYHNRIVAKTQPGRRGTDLASG